MERADHERTGTGGTGANAAPSALRVDQLCDSSGIRVSGGVDLATRPQWDETLTRTVTQNAEHADVRLDLSELAFIDVAGADLLVAASQRLAPPHRILLRRPPYALRLILDAFWPNVPTIEVEPA